VAGHIDMRKGFDGMAALIPGGTGREPVLYHVFVFRGRRDILKVLWFDGQGLMLLAKRLERGRFPSEVLIIAMKDRPLWGRQRQ
jgi:transposase